MEKSKRVAVYCRVSTLDKGQDLDTQKYPLKQYVKQRGREIYDMYEDKISGSKESRPGLDRMMKDAFKRKFDVVLVARFDRFGRSSCHLLTTLETFRTLGIDFVSLNEAVDTSTPAGQMMFTMISGFAQFERLIIQERVKSGLMRAKVQGKTLGRPPKKIDTEMIKSLRSEGLSLQKIADKVGIGKSSVGRILMKM